MRIGNFDPADLSDVGTYWLKGGFGFVGLLGIACMTATA